MKNPFLIDHVVYLRPLDKADAPCFVTWMNDPDVRQTLLTHRPIALAWEEEFLERAAKSDQDIVLGIVDRASDKLIGATGLHHFDQRSRHVGFGITIGDKEEWGKGYGTEATRLIVGYAFETLNLNRVWLHVYEYNERGIRTYERVGFRKEGVMRKAHFHGGRYWDTILMAILQEEWENKHRSA